MQITHHVVTSPVFALVKTVELDIQMTEDDAWTMRIELFQDTEQPNRFRCRAWESELFRLTPSSPRDDMDEPAHSTDDMIMVERGLGASEIASLVHRPFKAASLEAALDMIGVDLQQFLEHSSGKEVAEAD